MTDTVDVHYRTPNNMATLASERSVFIFSNDYQRSMILKSANILSYAKHGYAALIVIVLHTNYTELPFM